MRLAPVCLSLALASSIFSIAGCSGAAPVLPSFTPAKGKVSYNNKPLSKGSLMFEPEIGGREASAGINSDGTWEVSTEKAGDGMTPGPYRVYVSGLSKSQIPVKFHSPSSSGTTVEIKTDKSEYFIDFK
ncbi:MAG TPA: hypothetical protein VGH33_28015 [Isosphaeraceae bacterium]|jgi:hypothetical protein